MSWPAKFQHNLTIGAHCHQVLTCPIISKEDTCPLGVKPFLHKLKFHHFSCDIKLKVTWQKAGKPQPAVPSFVSSPFSPEPREAMTRPWKLLKQLEINSFSYQKCVLSSSWTKHMNPKRGNLRKCGLEGTKGIPGEFLARAPRLTPSLGWYNLP